jgi:predicted secreted protein
MKKIMFIVIVILLLYICDIKLNCFNRLRQSVISRSTPAAKVIHYTDPSKTIELSYAKAKFSIYLQSNATTGYSWMLVGINNKLIQAVAARYLAPNTRLVGAPGYERWDFKVLPNVSRVPRLTKIKLIYARPWDVTTANATTFKIALYPKAA